MYSIFALSLIAGAALAVPLDEENTLQLSNDFHSLQQPALARRDEALNVEDGYWCPQPPCHPEGPLVIELPPKTRVVTEYPCYQPPCYNQRIKTETETEIKKVTKTKTKPTTKTQTKTKTVTTPKETTKTKSKTKTKTSTSKTTKKSTTTTTSSATSTTTTTTISTTTTTKKKPLHQYQGVEDYVPIPRRARRSLGADDGHCPYGQECNYNDIIAVQPEDVYTKTVCPGQYCPEVQKTKTEERTKTKEKTKTKKKTKTLTETEQKKQTVTTEKTKTKPKKTVTKTSTTKKVKTRTSTTTTTTTSSTTSVTTATVTTTKTKKVPQVGGLAGGRRVDGRSDGRSPDAQWQGAQGTNNIQPVIAPNRAQIPDQPGIAAAPVVVVASQVRVLDAAVSTQQASLDGDAAERIISENNGAAVEAGANEIAAPDIVPVPVAAPAPATPAAAADLNLARRFFKFTNSTNINGLNNSTSIHTTGEFILAKLESSVTRKSGESSTLVLTETSASDAVKTLTLKLRKPNTTSTLNKRYANPNPRMPKARKRPPRAYQVYADFGTNWVPHIPGVMRFVIGG
ncbi:hypothetical protein L211DRAFT_848262 [Terfezia boudieri ATCC MYA-4762]|uniref:Uncharacterized protein n=1 Tax=Terfezia boudieri ATCC MYA-4762 TaxID=1051890 RepID=A0A3N4LR76_9PEZI|nr:hypothetical protein L211DRAFT_848262 [Terfezia boudieri ATCC MYA-4762]